MNDGYALYNIQEDTFMGRGFILWHNDSAKAEVWPRKISLQETVILMKRNTSGKYTDYDWDKIVIVPVTYDDDGDYHTDFLNADAA